VTASNNMGAAELLRKYLESPAGSLVQRVIQNFERARMKPTPTDPSPVMLSNPVAVVSVTSRVAQLPVPSQ
jgi:hypothetical protein